MDALKRPTDWKYAPSSASNRFNHISMIAFGYCFVSPATAPGQNEFVLIPAGTASVGKPKDFPSYGWDNEYGLEKIE